MKKHYILAGFLELAAAPGFAQVKIGAAGAPDASATLEVTGGAGNNKGLLLPASLPRNATPSPTPPKDFSSSTQRPTKFRRTQELLLHRFGLQPLLRVGTSRVMQVPTPQRISSELPTTSRWLSARTMRRRRVYWQTAASASV